MGDALANSAARVGDQLVDPLVDFRQVLQELRHATGERGPAIACSRARRAGSTNSCGTVSLFDGLDHGSDTVPTASQRVDDRRGQLLRRDLQQGDQKRPAGRIVRLSQGFDHAAAGFQRTLGVAHGHFDGRQGGRCVNPHERLGRGRLEALLARRLQDFHQHRHGRRELGFFGQADACANAAGVVPLEQTMCDRIGPVLSSSGIAAPRSRLARNKDLSKPASRSRSLPRYAKRHPIDLGQAGDFDRIGNVSE